MYSKLNLRLAVFFILIYTFLNLLIFVLFFIKLPFMNMYLDLGINIAVFILSGYLFFVLKSYLNILFKFHDIDIFIYLTIVLNAFYLLMKILGVFVPGISTIIMILCIIALIPLGIVQYKLGSRIEKLQNNLYGLLKPLSLATKMSGILYMTLILSLLGQLINILNNIILGIIFLKASNNFSAPPESLNETPQTV